jgi:enoyl-CoA hydratase/carnithine racemase
MVPGDGILTTLSYRARVARAEAFLLHPQPLAARTAHAWGVVAEVVPNGKALSRVRELAELSLKAPEVMRRNTRMHVMQPLQERIVREGGAPRWVRTGAQRSVGRRSRHINARQE